jgi:glycogen debranching enzyme
VGSADEPATNAINTVDAILSPEGWAYASSPPVEEDDPGRFHALFGRDSLIFALQVLPERPDVAAATLRAHAALLGRTDDAEIDEEPGKVIHEYRPIAPAWLIDAGWPVRDGGIRYYGTADATSWFLVLLAATGDASLQRELVPAREATAAWLERSLDHGDGLVRYGPRTAPGGLRQQGWRDALDPEHDAHGGGIVRADGTEPAAPLADADTQAVAVAALHSLAALDPDRSGYWTERAATLRSRVTAAFEPDVMAVEADGRPVPGAGSQLGWLLWADALEPAAAQAAAERLARPDVLTAYGLRTLSSAHPAFLPHGYHRGGIWPFDCWLGWAGLAAHDHDDAAEQVRSGVLSALEQLGRAPELYAVTADGALEPVAIANRVQAWTIGAAYALRSRWSGRPGVVQSRRD